MRLRLVIVLGLLCLFSIAQAQDNVLSIDPEELFEYGITVLEEIDIAEISAPYTLFSQDDSWQIENVDDESFLCQIDTDNCSQLLPRADVSTEYLDSGFICDPYWLEDGLISQSPDGNWVLFSACANASNQLRIDLYSYNLETRETIFLESIFRGYQSFGLYMKVVDWLDNYTPIVVTGELRTGSGHELSKLDVRHEGSYESLASQWAYQPYYSPELKAVYWSESLPADDGFSVIGWRILERNLSTDEIISVAEYMYEEARPGDLTVAHVIDANESWIVVGDSYPLSANTSIHFFDRATHDIRFSYPNLPNTVDNWDFAINNASLWFWDYVGSEDEPYYHLISLLIKPDEIEEFNHIQSRIWADIYLSDDDQYLLLVTDTTVDVYYTQTRSFSPVVLEPINGYRYDATWLPDNTLFVDIVRDNKIVRRWHVQIDVISESDT